MVMLTGIILKSVFFVTVSTFVIGFLSSLIYTLIYIYVKVIYLLVLNVKVSDDWTLFLIECV